MWRHSICNIYQAKCMYELHTRDRHRNEDMCALSTLNRILVLDVHWSLLLLVQHCMVTSFSAAILFLVVFPSCVFQSAAHTAIRLSDAVQRATVQIRGAVGNFARLLVWITSPSTVEHLPELQRWRDPRNRLRTARPWFLRGSDVHGNTRLVQKETA